MKYGHKATPESHEQGREWKSEGERGIDFPRMWGHYFSRVLDML